MIRDSVGVLKYLKVEKFGWSYKLVKVMEAKENSPALYYIEQSKSDDRAGVKLEGVSTTIIHPLKLGR